MFLALSYLTTKNIAADKKKETEKTINIRWENSNFKLTTKERMITDIYQIPSKIFIVSEWGLYMHIKLLHPCLLHVSNGKLKDSVQSSEVDLSLQRSLPCMCDTAKKMTENVTEMFI